MKNINGRIHPTVTENGIYGFFEEYRWLSNFHPCFIKHDGRIYSSSEALYMSFKTHDAKMKDELALITDAKDAKKFGRHLKLRPDWEIVKIDMMDFTVFQKFLQNNVLLDLLLKTDNLYLEETNYWNDNFWGVCNGKGLNMLGFTIMKVRHELKPQGIF